jgi:solute carrier family 25 phosphate transporter 23/24/25/41
VLTRRHGVIETQKKQNLISKFFQSTDLDDSGDITLEEFLDYAKKHEKKLKLIFREIDKNNDGKIDVGEVVRMLKSELGVQVDVEGVREVMGRLVGGLLLF